MIKSMKVKIYQDREGKQVCSREAGHYDCRFLLISRFGSAFHCGATGDELFHDETLWLRPTDNCPVRKDAK